MAEDSSRDRRDDRRGGPRKSFRAGGPRSGSRPDSSRRDDGGRDRDRGERDAPRRGQGGDHERRRGDSAHRNREGDRPARPGRPDSGRRGGPAERAERERPAHNPADLRAANRADQQRSPDIDADVTGKELDRGTLKEIGGLDERPGTWVAKHLVMAARYLEEDPALAFQHALAASRKGGRLARVREAVALTAYAAGEYQDALREFRTYRRMTGDDTHVAAQVDCERALGRPEKALQLAEEVDQERLDRAARVELAMVVSGIREDQGDLAGAHDALQVPELDRRRGYPFSPRLFQRQADVLAALGRRDEAAQWRRSVRVAERALGLGGFAEPQIMDIEVEPEEESRPRDRGRGDRGDRVRADRGSAGSPAPAAEESSPSEAEPDPNQMSLFDGIADADVADAGRRREEP